ncbi:MULTISPECIES: hypothetical protein [Bradyrhizobium]|uniref:hypothetical protein n=1 Tax=Bradyrhizobium centrosematis TaxID=1300039 RepID=UPI002167590E|nr:hypothetical protein [Bradyrhizobium centrosematis]MCS3765557.1 hypothetical protein [Bradyrhizobium centrosematis]MCS3778091.1 hypothetical protein [Bradyrhizobium centrosematis]
MGSVPFTRPTLIAAVAFLDTSLSQAAFNHMVLRLGLDEEIPSDTSISVSKKADRLGRILVQRRDDLLDTLEGRMSLAEAVVREAVKPMRVASLHPNEIAFARGLARDGYVVEFDDQRVPHLRKALPEELGLPEVDDEVHQLLKHFSFVEPLGHLDQGIEAHARGDWAAANAQFRTFLEGLFDEIARYCDGADKTDVLTSENRRALLAKIGFLAKDRNEWTDDGKNYINGLFKMLHTDGSHPGLSDEDHSTFRLHVVLVTGRTFLRRLRYQQ